MSARHHVFLTDDELVCLDGQCLSETQALVDAAKSRLAATAEHSDLDPRHAALIADVVTEANANGLIVWRHERIRSCSLCDDKPAGYLPYKSGPNKGLDNHKKPRGYNGIELADRFVRMTNHVALGGCVDCISKVIPALSVALADVRCQVPPKLDSDGRPGWKRFDNRHCTVCDWSGHSGQMGKDRTILGDGWVAAFCPNCGAGGVTLGGPRIVDFTKGYTVDVERTFAHEQRFDAWGQWPVEEVAA